jgi:hypothetical protein
VSATFTLSGVPGVCSFSVMGTLNSSGTQMVGNYAEVSCGVAVIGVVTSGGSIALTKQQAASSANEMTGATDLPGSEQTTSEARPRCGFNARAGRGRDSWLEEGQDRR